MSGSYQRKILAWVRSWEKRGYAGGIPDEAPQTLEELGRVPSYRVICLAIMKNDHALSMLGYGRPKCQLYNEIKRVEIAERNRRLGRVGFVHPEQGYLPGSR